MALIQGVDQKPLHETRRDDEEAIHTFREAPTKDQEPVIPAPQIFQSLLEPSTGKSHRKANSVPTVAECAAHLELLETFYALKVKVLASRELDSVLGIKPHREIYQSTRRVNKSRMHRGVYYGDFRNVKTDKIRYRTSAVRRREKWPFFLGLAVVRFKA